MTESCIAELFNEFRELRQIVNRLSSRMRFYGTLVTLGVVAIPAYGQIKTVFAQSQIEQVVDKRIEVAVVRAADLAATKAVQKLKEKQYCE